MGLDEARHGLDVEAEVDGEFAVAELLRCPRPNEVHPEDCPSRSVGLGGADHLHESLGLPDDLGPGVSTNWFTLGHNGETAPGGLLFGQPHEGHLWSAVDGPWNAVDVERREWTAECVADGDLCFGEANVGELRSPCDEVANGVDAGHGRHLLLGGDECTGACVVELETLSQRRGDGFSPDGNHHEIRGDRRTTRQLHRRSIWRQRAAEDLHPGRHRNPALGEGSVHDLRHVAIAAGEDAVEPFHEVHGDTEVGQHRCELTADCPATNHDGR